VKKMAFIRVKMIKSGNSKRPYSYLVENYWENGKVRQRTLKYLGVGDLRSKTSSSTSSNLGTRSELNEKATHEYIKKYYRDATIENGYVVLFHGTPVHNIEEILEDGLRGGDNTGGGNFGKWDNSTLFLTPNFVVAEKYGAVLKIEIPISDFREMNPDSIVDGVGDRCYVLETDDWEETIIDPEQIEQLNEDDEDKYGWY